MKSFVDLNGLGIWISRTLNADILYLSVFGTLDLADDVVPLAEEGEPFVQYGLLLVIEIIPLWYTLFGLEGRACEGTRSVLTGEDYYCQLM
jgi:hypothetical protein